MPPGVAQSNAGRLEVVPLDDLNIDHSYQRDLDANLVQSIARNWDIVGAGPITVSRREDGSLWIINGQHRAAAARVAGETEILAQVVEGYDRESEAGLRLKMNHRRSDRSQERFKAQVAAGDRESLAIVEILSGFNTRINPHPEANRGINSVTAVEKLYRKDNGVQLVRVLEVVRDAWTEVGGPFVSVSLLNSISWFLERHDQEMKRERFVERLRAEGVEAIDRKARSHMAAWGGALWMNYYRAMVEIYNKQLPMTSRLAWKTAVKKVSGAFGGGNEPDDSAGRVPGEDEAMERIRQLRGEAEAEAKAEGLIPEEGEAS